MTDETPIEPDWPKVIWFCVITYALGNIVFILVAANGVLGPIWPHPLLGYAGMSVFFAVLVLAAGIRSQKWPVTCVQTCILIAIALFQYWAAVAASAAV